jgi:hypothetical protein
MYTIMIFILNGGRYLSVGGLGGCGHLGLQGLTITPPVDLDPFTLGINPFSTEPVL